MVAHGPLSKIVAFLFHRPKDMTVMDHVWIYFHLLFMVQKLAIYTVHCRKCNLVSYSFLIQSINLFGNIINAIHIYYSF